MPIPSATTLAFHVPYHLTSSIQHLRPEENFYQLWAKSYAILKTVAIHLPHNYMVQYNISEQNRTYTTLVPSLVLISYKVQHDEDVVKGL